MKSEWESPRILIQEFEANEYVASCWGVGCDYNKANAHEQDTGNYWKHDCTHGADNCGLVANQVIKDYNDDGVADAMIETGTNGLGDLNCTIFSDESYKTERAISTVEIGHYIYWTTTSPYDHDRTWYHQGLVTATVPGHPNRS